jgi:hypothetical protein
VLRPGVDLLEDADGFPADGRILLITVRPESRFSSQAHAPYPPVIRAAIAMSPVPSTAAADTAGVGRGR